MKCVFCCLVQGVGEVTVYFLLLHGKHSVSQELASMIRLRGATPISYSAVKPLLVKNMDHFFNWVVFNLYNTTKTGCKMIMFERTLVAQRRGLSRDGREILASQGCLMKRTLYDSTLKNFLLDMIQAQK